MREPTPVAGAPTATGGSALKSAGNFIGGVAKDLGASAYKTLIEPPVDAVQNLQDAVSGNMKAVETRLGVRQPDGSPRPKQPPQSLGGALMQAGKETLSGIIQPFADTGSLVKNIATGKFDPNSPEQQKQAANAITLVGSFAGGTKAPEVALDKPIAAPDPSLIRRALFPETIGEGGAAAALRREASGTAERNSAATAAAFEETHKIVNRLTPAQQNDLTDYIEARSKGVENPVPQAQEAADLIRKAVTERRTALEQAPRTSRMRFVQDYFHHAFEDTEKADAFVQQWYQNSAGGATLKRGMPTMKDAREAGLVPKDRNPVNTTLDYVAQMDRHIAYNNIFDKAMADGYITYVHPNAIPEGTVQLKGRYGVRTGPGGDEVAVAPQHFARVWNNADDPGIHGWGQGGAGQAYDKIRKATMFNTMLELGFSGFHFGTQAFGAVGSDLATALQQTDSGMRAAIKGNLPKAGRDLLGAAKTTAAAPLAPINRYMQGRKWQSQYLGLSPATKLNGELLNVFEKSGGRAVGMDPSLRSSSRPDWWDSFQRGTIGREMMDNLRAIRAQPIRGTGAVFTSELARAMMTSQKLLFEKYTPSLKTGIAMNSLRRWVETHPEATHEEALAQGRKIVDSIDNRLGEMNQDILFMNKTLKQSAQLALRSYSWTLGNMRETLGGVKNIGGLLKGRELEGNTAYLIGIAALGAMVNSVFQYLHTGQGPQNLADVLHGRSGGVDPHGAPERLGTLGDLKDIYGFLSHPVQEAENKVNNTFRVAIELLTNSTFPNDPVFEPSTHNLAHDIPMWVKDGVEHVFKAMTPISMQNMGKGTPIGSHITPTERFFGMSPAGMQINDPTGFRNMMDHIDRRRWQTKLRHDQLQKDKYKQ